MPAAPPTTEILTVDGVLLNTFAYNVKTGTGRAKSARVRGTNQALAGRDGSLYISNKTLDNGEITLTMWIVACNTDGSPPAPGQQRVLFEQNREMLHRLFTKRHALIRLAQVMPNGTTRECYCDMLESVDFTEMAGRTRAEFSVSLQIPDVYWQDTATTSQTIAYTGSALSFTSFNASTGYIADSVLTVTGPITNPRVTDVASGIYVQFTGTVPAGQTWVVDAGNYTSTVNGASQLAATTHGGDARFMMLSPTNPVQLLLTGTSTTTATSLTVVARNKYVA